MSHSPQNDLTLPGGSSTNAAEEVKRITSTGVKTTPVEVMTLNMMDYDPWSKPVAQFPREAKEFTCPRYGTKLKLDLQGLGPIQQTEANLEAQKLIMNYVEAPEYAEEQAIDFIGPDEQTYSLTAAIITDITTIQAMMRNGDPSFLWWIGIITRHPEMFNEMKQFAAFLNNKTEIELRKKLKAKESGLPNGSSSN